MSTRLDSGSNMVKETNNQAFSHTINTKSFFEVILWDKCQLRLQKQLKKDNKKRGQIKTKFTIKT